MKLFTVLDIHNNKFVTDGFTVGCNSSIHESEYDSIDMHLLQDILATKRFMLNMDNTLHGKQQSGTSVKLRHISLKFRNIHQELIAEIVTHAISP
jgi:hypothetical protein